MVTLTPVLATVLVLLVALSVTAVSLTRLPLRKAMVTAAGRAGVQLAVVSTLLVLVLDSILWTLVYVACMFAVAAATSAGRLCTSRTRPWTAMPIAAGTVPVLSLMLGSGAVPWRPSGVLPTAGILLGGAMTATTLAGQTDIGRRRCRASGVSGAPPAGPAQRSPPADAGGAGGAGHHPPHTRQDTPAGLRTPDLAAVTGGTARPSSQRPPVPPIEPSQVSRRALLPGRRAAAGVLSARVRRGG